MSGYPYGNPQYPPPQGQIYPQYPPQQGQIYPQLYNPVNAPAPMPQYGQPGPQGGFPYQPQYQQGPGYPYQPGQPGQPGQLGHPPAAMSYPNVTPMAPSAPPGPGFSFQDRPNISPTPVNEHVVEWIPTMSNQANALSDRAVVAGYEAHDASPLWVIRARHEGDLIPGKFAAKHHAAYVAWGGKEHAVQSIEVLCARPEKVRWVEARNGVVVPPKAIVAGNTREGEPLYIGRARQQGSLTPGKVHPSHKVMYMSFGGKEIAHKSYEVLCTV